MNIKRVKHFNVPQPLMAELVGLIGDKKSVKIADIGSGPYSKIGRILNGVNVEVYPSDKNNFKAFWESKGLIPSLPIEIQNMEKLTYESDYFDIVYCANALDHTKNALAAVKELIRVTKRGGYVYLVCYLDQQLTGHMHYWNAKENGVFEGPRGVFDLKDLGFNIKFIDLGGLSRYNNIIATYNKI